MAKTKAIELLQMAVTCFSGEQVATMKKRPAVNEFGVEHLHQAGAATILDRQHIARIATNRYGLAPNLEERRREMC